MAESLNVIALISGGKDSFYSLLQCLRNGHNVVALGNLYPASVPSPQDAATEMNEHDLNSFMYQTVGHTVIPLYEQALGIPLYRQPIVGTAVQTGSSYGSSDVPAKGLRTIDQEQDETESLVPLLTRIMAKHPSANALSTGAILSTYQRTRIESVSLRLGLIPLAYLWQYPVLPPGSQISLLEDMASIDLDARIVKVASGGLDESFLWQNVASPRSMRRVEKAMKRFCTDGDGAVLGEGGEFETLVIDGPSHLFKARIEIKDSDRMVVREGGGSAWLKIKNATIAIKDSQEVVVKPLRIPELLESRFSNVLDNLKEQNREFGNLFSELVMSKDSLCFQSFGPQTNDLLHWTVAVDPPATECSISEEAEKLVEEIKQRLSQASLESSDIVCTTILLRQMQDFATLNKIYGKLFTKPNPPSRVTISCGDTLPAGLNIVISLTVHNSPSSVSTRKALHVQSRSYWAPANIGPYSQAISFPVGISEISQKQLRVITVAGQIPLIPHTMILPPIEFNSTASNIESRIIENFKLQVVLSLQHLWRIGTEMEVGCWTSVIAYLPRGTTELVTERAIIASKAWSLLHSYDIEDTNSENDDERDIWEEKYHAGVEPRGRAQIDRMLPRWSLIESAPDQRRIIPPFFAAEVEELPRQSGIEWHAHLGITGGPIQLSAKTSTTGWTVHQCKFGDSIQSIIAIEHLKTSSLVNEALQDALSSLGHSPSITYGHASYVDSSIFKPQISEIKSGMIPCRSVWAGCGRRLAALFIYDNL